MNEIGLWLGLIGFLIAGLAWLFAPTAEQRESLPTGLLGGFFLALAAGQAFLLYRLYTNPI